MLTIIAQSNLDGAQPVVWTYDTETRLHRVLTIYNGHKFYDLAALARDRFNEELSMAWTQHAVANNIY